jgi:hypothetical protein
MPDPPHESDSGENTAVPRWLKLTGIVVVIVILLVVVLLLVGGGGHGPSRHG